MSRALIIRPSSLGDIVHALPIVHDIRRHRPDIAVDWVAEEAFAALLAMHRGVDRVIPVALRRWRHHVLDRATWREAAAFRLALTRDRYDLVLDLQEQVKGALLALARARSGARPRPRKHSRARGELAATVAATGSIRHSI